MTARVTVLACLISSEAAAVEAGAEDRVTTHAVAIARGGPSTETVRCSGTLVSANVVLTVRHCIATVSPAARPCDATLGPITSADADDLWVNVSPWTADGASWKKVAGAKVPEPNRICGDDIALLVLDEPVSDREAVPARPVLDEASFLRAARERALGLAAFGVTSPHASDIGVRRSRFDIPIRCVPGEPGFACGPELDFIADGEITTGAGPCRGDSGGGAMPLSDRGVVFAVLSRGELGGDGTTCALGVFERTDRWAWLIARTVLDASSGRALAPAWAASAFPEQPMPGEFCNGNGSCGSAAECVSLDGERSWTCAEKCTEGASCDDGRRCEGGLCLPANDSRASVATPPGGCAITSSSHPAGGLGALLAALAAATVTLRARRDRSGRAASSCARSGP